MLAAAPAHAAPTLDALRRREFGRLRRAGIAYLDNGGSALYGASQLRAHRALLDDAVYGNPHSAHAPSRASTAAIDDARRRVLGFLDASPDEYAVCFTANASAAAKLVAESYPFAPGTPCVLVADNHNSIHGIREFARRAGAAVATVPLDGTLRLREAPLLLAGQARSAPPGGLFAYPAQSNFSGVRHPLGWIRAAQRLGYHVLLDAAAYVPTERLSLRRHPADFVVLSFYKIFGYPTGVGALVVRRPALALLRRPWFAGGTVEWASVATGRHRLRDGAEGFEDGTPDFLAIAALGAGFDLLDEAGAERIAAHVRHLTARFLDGLLGLRHGNGRPLVRIHGPADLVERGGTVAFNVLDEAGRVLPFERVEAAAADRGIALRGGCFCNPGAAEAAFGLDDTATSTCLDRLGGEFTHAALRTCVGPERAVGALRVSFGWHNEDGDVARALDLVAAFRI